jgi:hypothetical protein
MSLIFTTDKNYMKLQQFQPETMNRPNTLNSSFNYESSFTVVHGLGYVPLVRAYYNHNDAGTIIPVNGQAGIRTGFGPTLDYWFYIDEITTNEVVFKAEDFSSRTGTFTFYYKIYYDFEV